MSNSWQLHHPSENRLIIFYQLLFPNMFNVKQWKLPRGGPLLVIKWSYNHPQNDLMIGQGVHPAPRLTLCLKWTYTTKKSLPPSLPSVGFSGTPIMGFDWFNWLMIWLIDWLIDWWTLTLFPNPNSHERKNPFQRYGSQVWVPRKSITSSSFSLAASSALSSSWALASASCLMTIWLDHAW